MCAVDLSDPQRAARRMEALGNRQLLARASSTAYRSSRNTGRNTAHSSHSHLRASGVRSSAGLRSSLAESEDLMLEPNASSSRGAEKSPKHLPNVVAALEARVHELEAQLVQQANALRAAGVAAP